MIKIQGYSCFENRNFLEATFLMSQFFFRRNFDDELNKFFEQLIHCFVFEQLSDIKVNPVFFTEKSRVGRNLHCRDKTAKWSASSGSKKYQLASAETQS